MIQVLTAQQLQVHSSALGAQVFEFLTDLEVGYGGKLELPTDKKRGYGRQTVKSTIRDAARALGQEVRFRRASEDQVIFQRVR